jgi:TolB-like protein/thioredoxin-like negative regulator of GroEL
MDLFAELRRRNVIRMAGLYLVGSWLLVQVAETVLPAFDVPGWVLRGTIILLAIGFVPALVFAWIFEMTPEGLRRDAELDPARPIAPQAARRMDQLTLAGVLVLLAVVAADRWWPHAAAPADPDVPASATAVVSASSRARENGVVAVLPFRNRSVREEDAFFAEGIHDDLLTQLSKVASLRVISRTSMMRYRDSDKSIPEIARETGAAVVLEGAVQRSGDQVRITMQLIDGATDEHLWAETYDRALTADTLFAIQADIARVVTGALQAVLTPAEEAALAAGSTRSVEAYEAFLQGKLLSQFDRISTERIGRALAQFDTAIALDPQFADAWARKSRAQMAGYWYAVGDPALREAAAVTLAEATRLAPEATETWMAQAYFAYWVQRDYAGAEVQLARVLARSPEHAEAWLARAFVARRDGRFEDALGALRRALQIDPINAEAWSELGSTLTLLGRFDPAAEALSEAKRLGLDVRRYRVSLQHSRGSPQAAWALIDGPDPSEPALAFRTALMTRDMQHIALALSPTLWPESLRSPPGHPEAYALAQAEALLFGGQRVEAEAALRAIDTRLRALDVPYPGGWGTNAHYWPCDLPGLLGDLDGVLAAERDYLENAPRDVWASADIRIALAIALARAGDVERSLEHLEAISELLGPSVYPLISINPRLDTLRTHPRYLQLKADYERFAAGQRS